MALLLGYGAGAVNPYLALRGRSTRSTSRRRAPSAAGALRPRARQGPAQGHEQDGHLVPVELPGRADLRGNRDRQGRRRALVSRRRHRASAASAWARSRARRCCATRAGVEADVDAATDEDALDVGGVYAWRVGGERHLWTPRTVASLQKAVRLEDARSYEDYARAINDQGDAPVHAARAAGTSSPAGAPVPHRRGGAGGEHRAPLRDRRDELREHQQGSAREPRARDEPHRRRSRNSGEGGEDDGALRAAGQRRLAAQRDQAGGERALRRDGALPRQRRRAPDQDRPGREARRGRAAPRAQGRRRHRPRAPLGARA